MRVIGIGDNVCDKYVHQSTMYPGGQALNFAVYARMLGVESAYLGVFGSDEVAAHVRQTLDRRGVDRSRCRQYEGENGCARVSLVNGDRVFLGSNRGGVLREHPLELDGEDLAYIGGFDLCHTTNNSYMDEQLPRLREAGVPVSYDFSGQWTDEARVERVAPHVDYAFLSCGSVSLEQAQDICRRMQGAGAGMVIATRGSEGAVLFDGQDFYLRPPQLVEAVDTLGAGDSFATAFLLSWRAGQLERGEDMDSALRARLLEGALERAAGFSAQTCLVCGAFGEGKAYDPEQDG